MSVLKIKDSNNQWQDIPAIKGANGTNGADGISPTASVTKSGSTATITITDKNGTTTATISDGVNGTNGQNGRDGYVQYTAGNNITIENNVISASGGGEEHYLGNLSDYSSSNRINLNDLDVGMYHLYIQNGSYGTFNFYFKASQNDVETTLDTSVITTYPTLYNDIELCVYKKIGDVVSNELVLEIHYISLDFNGNRILRNVKEVKYNASTNTLNSPSVSNKTYNITSTDTSQTISGKKTFSTLPESSITPTTDNQLTNKKYVDDAVAGAGGGSEGLPIIPFTVTSSAGGFMYGSGITLNETERATLSEIITKYKTECIIQVIFDNQGVAPSKSYLFIPNSANVQTFSYTFKCYGYYYTPQNVLELVELNLLINGSWRNNVFSSYQSRLLTNTYYEIYAKYQVANDFLKKTNTNSYVPSGDYNPSTKLYTDKTHYENMAGYNSTKTQILKNINGTLTWVDE